MASTLARFESSGQTYTRLCAATKGSITIAMWMPVINKEIVHLSLQQAVEAHAGRPLPLRRFLVLISVRG
jgi:hypothetical protein